MNPEEYLVQYPILKNIKRFAMEVIIEPQNLCDHAYNVATIFYLLCKDLNVPLSAQLLFKVLQHDFVETYTGDINRKVKEHNDATKASWAVIEKQKVPENLLKYTDEKLTEDFTFTQRQLFEIADMFDALMYCSMEVGRGNNWMQIPKALCAKKIKSFIEDFSELLNKSQGFLNIIYDTSVEVSSEI